jgi:hypothetical protein
MDVGPVIAAIEEGGLSFILFAVMIIAVIIAMFITIAR